MKFSRINIMTEPIPTFDWSTLIEVFTPCITILIAFFKYVDVYFKSKKEEKAEFIEKIAEASVNKTLDKVFADQNSKISTLFEYREADRKHWDDRFDGIMNKLGK
jgi:hypothetical protein